MDKKKKLKFDKSTNETVYSFSPNVAYAEKCYLSNKASLPSAEQMGLDASQYQAIQLALESKLALIQGYELYSNIKVQNQKIFIKTLKS